MFNEEKEEDAAMGDSEEDETIPLIDKLQPALTGKNPRQRLSLFFMIALLSILTCGLLLGFNAGLGVEEQQRLITHICLFVGAIITITVAGISAVTFINSLRDILRSSDSKKESQETERTAHQKEAAQNPQAQQPRNHKRKAR